MSATATRPASVDEIPDEVFDVSAYELPIPKMDERKTTRLDIRLSGSGQLDRTNEDDLALVEAMRMGREDRLIVNGTIAGKAFRLAGSEDDELSYSCSVRVLAVEAGEIA